MEGAGFEHERRRRGRERESVCERERSPRVEVYSGRNVFAD